MSQGERDLIKLYSGQILALAASIPHTERLAEPDGQARKRSPLCGSTVTVDLRLKDGRIEAYGQEVRACALGQAAASVIGARAIGLDLATLQRGREQLAAMLKEGAPPPDGPFEELKVLEPARDFKNRHASILLSFDAAIEAFESALKSDCA